MESLKDTADALQKGLVVGTLVGGWRAAQETNEQINYETKMALPKTRSAAIKAQRERSYKVVAALLKSGIGKGVFASLMCGAYVGATRYISHVRHTDGNAEKTRWPEWMDSILLGTAFGSTLAFAGISCSFLLGRPSELFYNLSRGAAVGAFLGGCYAGLKYVAVSTRHKEIE